MANILIVDDEELARFTLQEILEAGGHVVSFACNGVEGLKMAIAGGVDLVVTDIIMPDKEGVEMIKDLKAHSPDLPIIAISGGGRTRNLNFLEIAQHFGADAVLAKPFTPAAIQGVVASLLPPPNAT